MRKVIPIILLLWTTAEASTFCVQEVNLKAVFFPLPYVRTYKSFGTATGTGENLGEAQIALAESVVKLNDQCKSQVSDIRTWCQIGKIKCINSETINPNK